MWMERGCQQIDSLADGWASPSRFACISPFQTAWFSAAVSHAKWCSTKSSRASPSACRSARTAASAAAAVWLS